MKFGMRIKSEFALILATLFWGLTFPFIRIALQEISPLQLVFLRGTIASFIFLPFILIIKKNRKVFFKLLPIGAVLGFLFFISHISQSIGLQTITSGRSAFITNLSIIFVPFLSPLFKRGMPSKKDLISCCIAIFGMYFLTDPFSSSGINEGDLWTILCAICNSLQIHILQWAMENKPYATVYAFWHVAFISIFALIMRPFSNTFSNFFPTSIMGIIALLYLGVVAMVVTIWIQTRYQRYTTPERASVIYILEPVFACIFGFIILHETMSLKNLFGGFLIICGVLWCYISKIFKPRITPLNFKLNKKG